jgi:hypothetical protein
MLFYNDLKGESNMDQTVSFSKGGFVHKPQKRDRNTPQKQSTDKQPWYKAYKNIWSSSEMQQESLQDVFSEIFFFFFNRHYNP